MQKSTTTPIPLFVLKSKQDSINIKPVFQRNMVWTKDHEELLIDSVLRGYYIPEVVFANEDDDRYELAVIDGQQRVRAVLKFMNDQMRIKSGTIVDKVNLSGLTYSQLPKKIKDKVDAYTLNYVLLTGTKEELQDMFLRLQNSVPLNKSEKRNAVGGYIRDFVNEVIKHDFFRVTCYVNEHSNSRMKYNEVVEQLLLMELYGVGNVDIKSNSIKKMYDEYNEAGIPEVKKEKIKKVLDFLFLAFGEKYSKGLFRKSSIHNLYIVASEYIENDPKATPSKFEKWFVSFETRRRQEKSLPNDEQSNWYKEYIYYVHNGTGNKESLITRKKIMMNDFLAFLNHK